VAREEGFRATPYRCPAGFLTVGYGLNLDAGISREEAELLLRHRLEVVGDALSLSLPWWGGLDEVRKGVLTAMAYQMGVGGLLKFKGTLGAVERGDYEGAARGMLGSLWARQTPGRARRTAEAMRSGRWPEVA
jgi:lysozyme